MPQMAPMNWLMIFFMFSIIFLMFNSMNYFNFINSPLNKNFKMKKISNNWKW